MSDALIIEKKDGINVVHFLLHEITRDQREEIKERLKELLNAGETKFVINLEKVGFLSSMVIAVIVFLAKEVAQQEGIFKLCCLSSEAMGVLQLTKLDKAFDIYETEKEALFSFK